MHVPYVSLFNTLTCQPQSPREPPSAQSSSFVSITLLRISIARGNPVRGWKVHSEASSARCCRWILQVYDTSHSEFGVGLLFAIHGAE